MQNKINFPGEPSDEIQTRIDAYILRQHELKVSKEEIAKRISSSYGYAYTPKDVASRLSLYQ